MPQCSAPYPGSFVTICRLLEPIFLESSDLEPIFIIRHHFSRIGIPTPQTRSREQFA